MPLAIPCHSAIRLNNKCSLSAKINRSPFATSVHVSEYLVEVLLIRKVVNSSLKFSTHVDLDK